MKFGFSEERCATISGGLKVWFGATMQLTLLFMSCKASSGCNSRLLVDRSLVPDSAFTYSSAISSKYTGSAARDDVTDINLQERAWCPLEAVHTHLKEYLQVDVGRQVIIKLIITKGRVAQSKGYQTTPFFTIRYKRELDGPWFRYQRDDKTTILSGNRDAMTENYITLEPPIIGRFIRIYPYCKKPTTTCLKLELLGCEANGVVEYQIPQGSILTGLNNLASKDSARFQDTTYDSYRRIQKRATAIPHTYPLSEASDHSTLEDSGQYSWSSSPAILTGGLGKLSDNDTDSSPSESYKFIGWKRQYIPTRYEELPQTNEQIRLLFRFDGLYNFTSIHIFVANEVDRNLLPPANITIQFGIFEPPDSQNYAPDPKLPVLVASTRLEDWVYPSKWIKLSLYHSTGTVPDESRFRIIYPTNVIGLEHEVDKKNSVDLWNTVCVGRFVEIRLHFTTHWVAIAEVAFQNYKVDAASLKKNFQDPHEKRYEHQINAATSAIKQLTANDAEYTQTVNTNATLLDTDSQTSSSATTYSLTILCSVLITVILFGVLVGFCCHFVKREKHEIGLRPDDPNCHQTISSCCCAFCSFTNSFRRGTKYKPAQVMIPNGSSAQFDCQQVLHGNSGQTNNWLQEKATLTAIPTTTSLYPAPKTSITNHQHVYSSNNNELQMSIPANAIKNIGQEVLTHHHFLQLQLNSQTIYANNVKNQSPRIKNGSITMTHPMPSERPFQFPPLAEGTVANLNSSTSPSDTGMHLLDSPRMPLTGSSHTGTLIQQQGPGDLVQIIPIDATTQQPIFHPGYHHGSQGQPGLQTDLQMSSTYRRVLTETGTYTSLPGSECDAQPYARMLNQNNNVVTQEIDGLALSFASNVPTSLCKGAISLPLSFPPPPSFPLPPTPSSNKHSGRRGQKKITPVRLTYSTSSSSGYNEVSTSQTVVTTTDSHNILLSNNEHRVVADNTVSSSIPLTATQVGLPLCSASKNVFSTNGFQIPHLHNRQQNDPEDRVMLLPAHLQSEQRLWLFEGQANLTTSKRRVVAQQYPTLRGSDYSTVTMGGSSNNAYGICYGTPGILLRHSAGTNGVAYR